MEEKEVTKANDRALEDGDGRDLTGPELDEIPRISHNTLLHLSLLRACAAIPA